MIDIIHLPEALLAGILSAMAYSIVFYAKKQQKGEKFDPQKLGATLVVGAATGAFLWLNGVEITQENVVNILVANVGIIALAESVIKWASRELSSFSNGSD